MPVRGKHGLQNAPSRQLLTDHDAKFIFHAFGSNVEPEIPSGHHRDDDHGRSSYELGRRCGCRRGSLIRRADVSAPDDVAASAMRRASGDRRLRTLPAGEWHIRWVGGCTRARVCERRVTRHRAVHSNSGERLLGACADVLWRPTAMVGSALFAPLRHCHLNGWLNRRSAAQQRGVVHPLNVCNCRPHDVIGIFRRAVPTLHGQFHGAMCLVQLGHGAAGVSKEQPRVPLAELPR